MINGIDRAQVAIKQSWGNNQIFACQVCHVDTGSRTWYHPLAGLIGLKGLKARRYIVKFKLYRRERDGLVHIRATRGPKTPGHTSIRRIDRYESRLGTHCLDTGTLHITFRQLCKVSIIAQVRHQLG